jgi:hypothetical protein
MRELRCGIDLMQSGRRAASLAIFPNHLEACA